MCCEPSESVAAFEYIILRTEGPRSFGCSSGYDYTTNEFETEQSERFSGNETNIFIVLTYH